MKQHEWWQKGIIYQVYPRSFQDSNGDGVGDIQGLRQRLAYLESLGVDAIWITPVYPSPMDDFGYDVTDYTGVDPLFGTLDDLDRLMEDVHNAGMRLIMDFVPNHTSYLHPWFVQSRSSRDNPKRDWYIWRDPRADGSPPNNWRSVFGGSGWEWDQQTGQYYYHAFLPQQPDLNWRNPEVQEAMLDCMRFWLSRGVDGFRVDVIWHVIKDEEMRDNPPNPQYVPSQRSFDAYLAIYSTDRPEVHDIVEKMREVAEEYPERVIIGEIYLPVKRLVAYYGSAGRGAHMPFNFQLIGMPWNASLIQEAIQAYENALPAYGWPNWVLGNHDTPRIVTRIGKLQARNAAMLLLTLRGTPTMYYGDELGMEDVEIPHERIRDPFEIREPGKGNGRDPARTPMQWNSRRHAGFTSGEPWLPVPPDARENNVARQKRDPHSIHNLYRRLIKLRSREPALSIGSYHSMESGEDLLAYRRCYGDDEFLVLLNLGHNVLHFSSHELAQGTYEIVLSTHLDRTGTVETDLVELRPHEGLLLKRR